MTEREKWERTVVRVVNVVTYEGNYSRALLHPLTAHLKYLGDLNVEEKREDFENSFLFKSHTRKHQKPNVWSYQKHTLKHTQCLYCQVTVF